MREFEEITARLAKQELRTEALIGAVGKMSLTLESVRDKVDELIAWASEPPSSDLSDALTKLAATINDLHEGMDGLGRNMPDLVAEGVRRADATR